MSDLHFSVRGVADTATRSTVTARGFTMTIDEPPVLGGEDAGANPVEYVLSALLGCFTVVVHMVAKEMGLTVGGLDMVAEGDLNPARLMGQDTEDRAGFKRIQVTVKLDADADPDQVRALLAEVERRCPVADTLAAGTPVTVQLG